MNRAWPLTSALILCAALGHAAQSAAPQSPAAPPPQFRAGTDLIQVEVSVLDSRRQPVRGLAAADFTLLDDGVARPIDAFTQVDLPPLPGADKKPAAAWTREVAPDITSNRVADEEGRIVIILMDRTITVGPPTLTARKVASRLVSELGPNDLAAVISTSGGATQNLTSDKARLLKTIARANAGTRNTDDITDTDAQTAFFTFTPMMEGECLCGLCVLDTITRVAQAVEEISRRRKALFFIGSDVVFQSADAADPQAAGVSCGIRLADARAVMFKAIDRANLTIHSVDPTGLARVGPTSQASSNIRAGGSTGAAARQAAATTENLGHQDALRVLPSHTGGRAVMNTNAPEEMVPAILRESESYYVLGFRPANAAVASPAFRKIEVKVARKDVQVRARSGYLPAGSAPPPAAVPALSAVSSSTLPPDVRATLAAAIAAPLPRSAVSMELGASVFDAGGAARPMVAVSIGLDRATSGFGEPGAREVVHLLMGAFTRDGRPVASAEQAIAVTWPPAGPAAPRRLDLVSHLDLPPGDYELRLAMSGADAARASSAFTFVTVPDFRAEPLALSTIALAGGAATATLRDDAVGARLPLMPSTQRAFAPSERLVGLLRIYQGTRRTEPLAPVALRIEVIDASGEVAASQAATVTPEQFTDRAAEHFISLPLAGLAPGDYLLRIEAAMNERAAGRAVRFSVK